MAISSQLIGDTRWKMLMQAAGYGLSNLEPSSLLEYGMAGFVETSFRPVSVRGSGKMHIWGEFHALL